MKKVAFCLLAVAMLAGSVAWAMHHEAEYQKLPQQWQDAYNTGDASKVAALYLEDGMRMPPDMPIVKGRAAVQAQIQAGMDQGLAKVEIQAEEAFVSEDMGVSRGTFKGMDADGNQISAGKWVNYSRYVDGKWQAYLDIWNYDAPLVPPQ